MARSKGFMSEQLKIAMARELGVSAQVEGGYFGNLSSKDCGKLVKQAIFHAERIMAQSAPNVSVGANQYRS